MIRLRDEYGLTGWGMGLVLGLVGLILIGGVIWLSWAAWPKDSHGNALPCTHTHQEVTYVMSGKVLVPITTDVCDTWASPSPAS